MLSEICFLVTRYVAILQTRGTCGRLNYQTMNRKYLYKCKSYFSSISLHLNLVKRKKEYWKLSSHFLHFPYLYICMCVCVRTGACAWEWVGGQRTMFQVLVYKNWHAWNTTVYFPSKYIFLLPRTCYISLIAAHNSHWKCSKELHLMLVATFICIPLMFWILCLMLYVTANTLLLQGQGINVSGWPLLWWLLKLWLCSFCLSMTISNRLHADLPCFEVVMKTDASSPS
jgi:hypothetical protein